MENQPENKPKVSKLRSSVTISNRLAGNTIADEEFKRDMEKVSEEVSKELTKELSKIRPF